MYKHERNIVYSGLEPAAVQKAIIFLHGRGASAEDILSLKYYLKLDDFAILAPEATNASWYPHSFLAPRSQNQPALQSALDLISSLVEELQAAGVSARHIYLLGFSQGACLSLEWSAQHAQRLGGIFALSGGLIGQQIQKELYTGNFDGTPVFIGCSDRDMHIPLQRVLASAQIYRDMGAEVDEQIYTGMGHTVITDELDRVNKIITG